MMLKTWAGFVFAMASALRCHAGTETLQARGDAIRDRFVAAIRQCGVQPSFVPTIRVKTSPNVVVYWPKSRDVWLSRYAELPPPIRGFVDQWAAGSAWHLPPAAFFAEVTGNFLVAHELGHYLVDMGGRMDKLSNWQNEVEANRIAIAFWQLRPGEAKTLPERIDNNFAWLATLSSPVPAGHDAGTYFNDNYARLSQDGAAYSWYQGAFVRSAWADRGKKSFCDFARENRPPGAR
jgi:hypothetical protein